MICDRCDREGIVWHALTSLQPYTKCPHCGGMNCQRVDPPEEEDAAEEWDQAAINYGMDDAPAVTKEPSP